MLRNTNIVVTKISLRPNILVQSKPFQAGRNVSGKSATTMRRIRVFDTDEVGVHPIGELCQ